LLLLGGFIAFGGFLVDALQDPDFYTDIGVSLEDGSPDLSEGAIGGPSAVGTSADSLGRDSLNCFFTISSGDGQPYSLGYYATWKQPSGALISSRTYSHYTSDLTSSLGGTPVSGVFGTYTCAVDWNVNPWGWIGTSQATLTVRPVCAETDRTNIIAEYYGTYGVVLKPQCSDFTQGPIDGTYFQWSEWMTI
jgi:hypothetical protein